jgi:hypothetical protein
MSSGHGEDAWGMERKVDLEIQSECSAVLPGTNSGNVELMSSVISENQGRERKPDSVGPSHFDPPIHLCIQQTFTESVPGSHMHLE